MVHGVPVHTLEKLCVLFFLNGVIGALFMMPDRLDRLIEQFVTTLFSEHHIEYE